MSGGGSYSGTPVDSKKPCDKLRFETTLASPNPGAIKELKVGDTLSVSIETSNGKKILAVLKGKTIVGTITEKVAELIRCIQEGNTFEAKILSISGGAIKVEISFSA